MLWAVNKTVYTGPPVATGETVQTIARGTCEENAHAFERCPWDMATCKADLPTMYTMFIQCQELCTLRTSVIAPFLLPQAIKWILAG
jgi:hypothetical protein